MGLYVHSKNVLTIHYCCTLQEAGMELVGEVREGLKQRMSELEWLDSETRQLAIEKVRVTYYEDPC